MDSSPLLDGHVSSVTETGGGRLIRIENLFAMIEYR